MKTRSLAFSFLGFSFSLVAIFALILLCGNHENRSLISSPVEIWCSPSEVHHHIYTKAILLIGFSQPKNDILERYWETPILRRCGIPLIGYCALRTPISLDKIFKNLHSKVFHPNFLFSLFPSHGRIWWF